MPEEEGDWLYYYQVADGQWVFLHPLNVRCLLACHGSYSALPPTLRARAVEVEELSQSEDSRRRLKFALHLPLSGPFRLVELDLAPLLPPSALAPFADEISARERRRRRRAEERRREAARDKKAAAAAARARQGPSLEEWRLQPRLGAGVSQLADEVAGRLELDGEGEEEEENEQEGGGGSQGGVSFANITRMGFAAAVDSPSLASPDNPPLPGAALTPSAAPLPAGAWGRPRPAPSSEPPAPSPPAAGGSRGRRGRKGTVLLSSTGGQRRY
eukprot:CAMPEP_0177792978 /NCGR_PEP_ID=MMETSP0491_2-20121128/24822_1 /TAXON_ID=63592 /ORGANISM="Tetraselmis chuii, Strain PLY429" /LENGTH=271 /DNA_ID=CAMNT_0019315447 /DNA_START=60 /DNA_END=875 /DNA_ORIENTATION=-